MRFLGRWFSDAWYGAVNGFTVVGRFLAQVVLYVLVWSPIWVPVVLVGLWVRRRYRW